MPLTRKSLFGFPPNDPPPSDTTVRLVPLTYGERLTEAWPLLPPGSSVTMTNFLPLDGVLIPRSGLSSLNTSRPIGAIYGIAELQPGTFGTEPDVWISGSTLHAVVASNGSISVASFVSANGIGPSGLLSNVFYQYAPAFFGNINENGLVAAGTAAGPSYDTLLCLYHSGGNFSNQPRYSYLTGAPKAKAVAAFDNYIVAFNQLTNGPTRVQWCQRGDPTNWTGEGSGYEDLLDMSGAGMAVKAMPDGRMILFSTRETWYAVTAAYPAQFQFYPLEKHIGCPFPNTIARTDAGLVFLGSDLAIRFLPVGGGASQVIAPGLAPVLRHQDLAETTERHWAVYDPYTKLYYLFIDRGNVLGDLSPIVLNTVTGEWGSLAYSTFIAPSAGINVSLDRWGGVYKGEGLLFVSSSGTVYSTSSVLGTDSGNQFTATWRSGVLAADLPANHKLLKAVDLDYRATSKSTLTLKLSTDGGNNFETTGRALSLTSAPFAGRVQTDLYQGGAMLALEITSQSTGYELHRLDVTLDPNHGRRA